MKSERTKKTIVWDLDDVLNNLMEAWLEKAWLVEYAGTRIRYHQLRSNPPLKELSTTADEYLASLDRFRLSAGGAELKPQGEVFSWFQQFGNRFKHHVLTARPLHTVSPASAWVFRYFGQWVRHFHFVPSSRPGEDLPSYDRTKGEVLANLGPVDFFVDDSVSNVNAAAALGIHSFVFPQPWNPSGKTVPAILNELSSQA